MNPSRTSCYGLARFTCATSFSSVAKVTDGFYLKAELRMIGIVCFIAIPVWNVLARFATDFPYDTYALIVTTFVVFTMSTAYPLSKTRNAGMHSKLSSRSNRYYYCSFWLLTFSLYVCFLFISPLSIVLLVSVFTMRTAYALSTTRNSGVRSKLPSRLRGYYCGSFQALSFSLPRSVDLSLLI